jgi:DNA recombination protein RmuC
MSADIFIIVLIVLAVINIVLTILVFRSGGKRALEDILTRISTFRELLERNERIMREEFQRNREESGNLAKQNREEQNDAMNSFARQFKENVDRMNDLQKEKFAEFGKRQQDQSVMFEGRMERMKEVIENRLKEIREDNSKKLEEMRKTVDEKLQETLEKRIGESFRMVSEQLEQVYKGLGDMQKLATGVGDLKKVLTNVKTRGTMGEIQLGTILEQFLSPEQYIKNARIKKNTAENVEFAVRLPGNEAEDEYVLLPIDSKFPVEDYQRLMEMYEHLDNFSKEEIQKAENGFDSIVKRSAKTIREKYIDPPHTTNFAIMFLPTEGLYAQVLRRPGLFDQLQRDYKVTVVGPSNLVAFLSSLQMGFRTLAVQKRSNEVWKILGAVKTEFDQFETVLKAAQQQINNASGKLDTLVGTRTRVMKRKLREVEELPGSDARQLLGFKEETPEEND